MSDAVVVMTPDQLRALVKEAVAEALDVKFANTDTLPLRACGVSVRSLRAAIADGDLPACKVGREYRVRRADLDHWLEARKVEARPAAEPKGSPADRAVARAMGAGSLRLVGGAS